MKPKIIECLDCHKMFLDSFNQVCKNKSLEYFFSNQESVNCNIGGRDAVNFEYLTSEDRKCELLLAQNKITKSSFSIEAISQKKAIRTEFTHNEIAEENSPNYGTISATASSDFYDVLYILQRHKLVEQATQKDKEQIQKFFFPKKKRNERNLNYKTISEQSLKIDMYSSSNSAILHSQSRHGMSTMDLEAQKQNLRQSCALQVDEDTKNSSQVISHVQRPSDDETVKDYRNIVSISTTNAVANPSIHVSEQKLAFCVYSPLNSVILPSNPFDGLSTEDSEVQKEKINERSALHVDDDIKISQITSLVQETSVDVTVDYQNLDSPGASCSTTNNADFFWCPENKHFVCPTCKKSTKYRQHFARHLRIHSGEKPFSCDVCDMCFTRKDGLQYHIKTHTGEKSFYCDKCGKGFISKHKLDRHVPTHAKVKPFACGICEKRYTRKYDLNQHIKIHSKVLKY